MHRAALWRDAGIGAVVTPQTPAATISHNHLYITPSNHNPRSSTANNFRQKNTLNLQDMMVMIDLFPGSGYP